MQPSTGRICLTRCRHYWLRRQTIGFDSRRVSVTDLSLRPTRNVCSTLAIEGRSLEDPEDLPDPDVLAQEIADDLQTALEQFSAIAEELKE